MSEVLFPRRRLDGTASVSARFEIERDTAVPAVVARVRSWVSDRKAAGIDLTADLSAEPYVVVSDGKLDVVFEAVPSSRRWKDWMVLLSQTLASSVSGIRFACFYDLVANRAHPASTGER